MPRQFNMDMDYNLFNSICKASAELNISPAAFVERSIRHCIEVNPDEVYTERRNNQSLLLGSENRAVHSRYKVRPKIKPRNRRACQ